MADGPNELFVEVVAWMGRAGLKNAKNLPQPVTMKLETGDDVLTIRLNASQELVGWDGTEIKLGPFDCFITSEKYLAAAHINPHGGMLGGFKEDDLIAAFKNATPDSGGR